MRAEKRKPNSRLRKYRKQTGMSQRTVAGMLGHKDTSLISRWENGTAYPSLENALRLSRIYKRLVDDLFYELGQEITEALFPKKTAPKKPKINDP